MIFKIIYIYMMSEGLKVGQKSQVYVCECYTFENKVKPPEHLPFIFTYILNILNYFIKLFLTSKIFKICLIIL